ncbi:hypothetical protein GSI_13081 [Ganoderma sinense ZZ0214-1]|uniref:Uncharacterized protein n=1 Tax=Ganoderma sinense ZZ0214-1 TaxID=1077348 RepID=A0A2G8RUJ7_9APHY|nr:hypothetical protein GSI_13081 [Ganoderma sinense ZZ0214-1]
MKDGSIGVVGDEARGARGSVWISRTISEEDERCRIGVGVRNAGSEGRADPKFDGVGVLLLGVVEEEGETVPEAVDDTVTRLTKRVQGVVRCVDPGPEIAGGGHVGAKAPVIFGDVGQVVERVERRDSGVVE